MRKVLLTLLLLCVVAAIHAQRISREYNNVSLSEALRQLNNEATDYEINFLYNELEDFRITTSVQRKNVPDAIRQMIGFYPIRMNVDGTEITVECIQKADNRYQGTVIDADGQPVAYANIALLSSQDSTLITGGVSNENGVFIIPCEQKPLLARISHVSYKTVYRLCHDSDLGTILMQPETIVLNGISVKGRVPQYQMGDEGMITNVEHTPLSQLGTAHDVMRHIPGIIQRDNEYEVFGKGKPLIYINGREMRSAKELEQLKSTDIKNIELIVNPGAKYDATVNAVVKIQTIRKAGDGFSVDTWGRWQQSHLSKEALSLDLNYRHNGLDVFGSFWASEGRYLQEAVMEQEMRGDSLWYQQNKMRTESREQDYTLEGGFNFSPNEQHAFGVKYELGVPSTNEQTTELVSNVERRHQHYDRWHNHSDERTKGNVSHKLNAYYMGSIGKLGIDLNLDYLHNGYDKQSSIMETCEVEADRQIEAENIVRNRMFASKLTLTHPLLGGSADFGAEYINTHRQDDYVTGRSPYGSYYVDPSFSTLKEQSICPYAEYSRKLPSGQLRAGLRYEYVWFNYYNRGVLVPEQSRSYGNFYPSVSFGTKINDVKMLFSYSAKTTRPTYRQLSNGIFYGNRYSMSKGNPLLDKSTRHTATVQVSWKWVQLSLSYTNEHDAIVHWIQELHPYSIETIVTYKNIPSIKTLSPMIVLSPTIGVWHPTFTAEIIKPWLTMESFSEVIQLNKPIAMLQLNNTFSFPHGLTAEMNFRYQSRGHCQNVYMSYQQAVLDVSIIKTFLHERLSIKLAGEDLLSRSRDGNHTYNRQVRLYQGNYYDRRRFSLTVRYHFNTPRSKYKGTGAGNEEKTRL
ncbi:MAG: outer membrane beta-barrel protein [Bacteroidaceae bacterium]|nr:outer membrane beta-barrel protein [Bacteroidaceae bacterium]